MRTLIHAVGCKLFVWIRAAIPTMKQRFLPNLRIQLLRNTECALPMQLALFIYVTRAAEQTMLHSQALTNIYVL
jgi:hypothetical protein